MVILELQNNNVPGDAIGDILVEAESHLADSGESPDMAFGEPRAYARERAASIGAKAGKVSDIVFVATGGGIGGATLGLGLGVWGRGTGEPAPGGIPAWIMALVGVAIVSCVFLRIKPDTITDPRTGKPMDSILSLWSILIAGFGGMVAIVVLMEWFLGR